MSRAAHLMLEAKKAITDEQLQKFLSLARQEHWEEAAKQLGVTLACVADLLDEGAETLLTLEPQQSNSHRPFRMKSKRLKVWGVNRFM
jgi:hypothetical protein